MGKPTYVRLPGRAHGQCVVGSIRRAFTRVVRAIVGVGKFAQRHVRPPCCRRELPRPVRTPMQFNLPTHRSRSRRIHDQVIRRAKRTLDLIILNGITKDRRAPPQSLIRGIRMNPRLQTHQSFRIKTRQIPGARERRPSTRLTAHGNCRCQAGLVR